MKRRIVILLFALVPAMWLTCHSFKIRTAPTSIAISFLGYTNVPFEPEIVAALGQEPQAFFLLSNRTAMQLYCRYELIAICTNGLTSEASGEYNPIPAHGTRSLSTIVPTDTNGWRFRVVLSTSGPRPRWQRDLYIVLKRIGFDAPSLAGERKYRPVTNEWSFARN